MMTRRPPTPDASPRRRLVALCLLGLAWTVSACSLGTSVVGGPPDAASPLDAGSDVPDATVTNDLADATDLGGDRPVTPDAPDAPDAPMACRANADCASDPGGAVCDTASGRCVRCVPSADTCPAAQHCDPMTFACIDGCRSDDGCAAPPGADGGVPGDGGEVDAGDAGVPARVCDVTAHACVQCRTDEHCPGGMLCVGQVCVMGCSAARACPGTATCCDGACVETQTNTGACGACGRACAVTNGSPACAGGRCTVASCTAPFADCNNDPADGCETDTSASGTHCGMCGRACSFANAAGACASGTCAITACNEGFADCDTSPANGCETDTRSAVTACGMCGRACSFANAAATCAAGACALGGCNPGFADCDANAANGCEVNLGASAVHCGRCGNACSFAGGTAACTAGVCTLTMCAAGLGDCDGNRANGCETDTTGAVSHCGACGTMCVTPNATPACRASGCVIGACAAGFADCNALPTDGCEVSTRTEVANCGACGRACALPNATPACAAGGCVVAACATGFSDCDGADGNGCEVDLRTSTASCGACGRTCSFPNAAAVCTAGACALGACAAGFADCDANPANGCEVDARSSVDHCGACGRVCSTGRCAAGVCDRGGDGSDGTLNVVTATTLAPAATPLVADVAAGGSTLRVISAAGFAAGNEVLVIAMQGADAGRYEFARVSATTSNTLTLAAGLAGAFHGATERVQVVRVLRYDALTVAAAQTLSTTTWNGSTGGVLAVRVSGAATIAGSLVASERGFRGGAGDAGGRMCGAGAQGESPTGVGARSTAANGGGGGGGGGGVFCCGGPGQSPGGGGGGHGAAGDTGTGASGVGAGGGAYGAVTLAKMFPGSGGGGGGGNCDVASGGGGAGGAVLFLAATTLTVTGDVASNGAQGGVGGGYEGAGAGGAGGSVFLAGRTVTVTAGRITASGGASNVSSSGVGGAGAVGRVRIECATLNGVACPAASGAVATPAATVGTY